MGVLEHVEVHIQLYTHDRTLQEKNHVQKKTSVYLARHYQRRSARGKKISLLDQPWNETSPQNLLMSG